MQIIQTPTWKSSSRGGNKIEAVIFHWIVGDLAAADREIKNPLRMMSYSYAVQDDVVHQYVQNDRAAWHCGVFSWNQKSIGISVAGGPNMPISEKTYATVTELLVKLFKEGVIGPNTSFIGHKDIKPTQCPGTFNYMACVIKAQEALKEPAPKPADPVPAKSAFPCVATVLVDALRVRDFPKISSAVITQPTKNGRLNKGDQFRAVGIVYGDNVEGDNRWLKSAKDNYVAAKYCKW